MKKDDARKAVLKDILSQSKKALMAKGESKEDAAEKVEEKLEAGEAKEAPEKDDEEKKDGACPMCGKSY